ncbi:MAG: hypothetical protein IT444_01245 [Phycisphaeraceae bacterium]|nr:hypothetical protein [Phycisphaeraceae bacterium]
MQDVKQQLESVQHTARRLLVAQVVARWLAVVLLVALTLGVVDYVLRLPAWFRVVTALVLLATAGYWLWTRLMQALDFHPDLSTLALRAEGLYPQLDGLLATGVEFSAQRATYSDNPRAASLVDASISSLRPRLSGVAINRLINPKRSLIHAGTLAAVIVGLSVVIVLAPWSSALAARRWLMPWSGAEWPRRTNLTSMTRQAVWPSDTPVRLQVRADGVIWPGMRAWAYYRLRDSRGIGAWQQVLLNEQATETGTAGRMFEGIVDPTIRAGEKAKLEFYFQAGDGETPAQELAIVERPAVIAARLNIEPPVYARGVVAEQAVTLDELAGPLGTASALEGSTVRWRFELNKPIPTTRNFTEVLPGLAGEEGVTFSTVEANHAGGVPAIEASFKLKRSVQTRVQLVDEYGLGNVSERNYRIEMTVDQPPVATVSQPASDEAVLATAVLQAEGLAQDDLAVQRVTLTGQRIAAGTPSVTAVTGSAAAPGTVVLREVTGRANRLTAGRSLEIASLGAKPNDEVVLLVTAQDIFDLDGKRHQPVTSTPRRLRIIDPATLSAQIRTELDAIRDQAIHINQQQRDLLNSRLDHALAGQEEISRRVENQSGVLQSLQNRMTRNRLGDAQLSDLMQKAESLLNKAKTLSETAKAKLDDDRKATKDAATASKSDEATKTQAQVADTLTDLVSLLDRGRDTAGLLAQLQALMSTQSAIAADTRGELPKTLGKTPEQLTPAEKKMLDDLAGREAALSAKIDALSRQLHSTADSLAENPKDPADKETAQTLKDAAEIAEKQGLLDATNRAGDALKENKLSEAGNAQQQALTTMQAMLDQMSKPSADEQEMLRRKMMALVESIEKLIAQQKAQMSQLAAAQDFGALESSLGILRRNTLSVEDEARQSKATGVAKHLADAAGHQGDAAAALRERKRQPAAEIEKLALVSLEAALAEAKNLRDEAQSKANQKERTRLKEEYAKLAKVQEAINNKTTPLASGQLNRRQRAELIALGDQQADFKEAARKLGEEVEDTLLFKHLHDQIDKAAQRVTTRLRGAQADEEVLDDQEAIVSSLQTMIAALDQAQKDDPFAKPQDNNAGNGGGGGGGEPPLVPPIAQLKALRGMQATVYQRTKRVSEASNLDAAARKRRVLQISAEQRALSGLGEDLIESMKSQPPVRGGQP